MLNNIFDNNKQYEQHRLNGNFYEYKLLLMDDTQRTRLIEGYRLRYYVNPIGKLLMSKQRKTL